MTVLRDIQLNKRVEVSDLKRARRDNGKDKVGNTFNNPSSSQNNGEISENLSNGSENEQPWLTPKKRKTGDKRAKNNPPTPEDISMSNSFNSLEEAGEVETDTVAPEKEKEAESGQRTNMKSRTQKPEEQRPPPITTLGKTLKEIAEIFASENSEVNQKFHLRQPKDTDFVTITTKDMETFKLFKQTLTDKDIRFYTYTPKGEKPKSIVLKGLYGDYNEKDVEKDLKERKLENVEILKVSKIFFNKSKVKEKEKQNFAYLVQLSNTSVLSKITSIKTLLYQKIRWEQLRRDKLFQCKNCQRIGHAKINCTLPARCVKCGLEHEVGNCLIDKNADRASLMCANCGLNGHPANWRGCIFFKGGQGILDTQMKVNNQIRRETEDRVRRTLEPKISYARATERNNNNLNNGGRERQFSQSNRGWEDNIQHRETVTRAKSQEGNSNDQNVPKWAEIMQGNMELMQDNILKAITTQMNSITKQVEINTQSILDIQNTLEQLKNKNE